MSIPFRPLSITDKDELVRRVFPTDCRNCDLSFVNLFSWRHRYETEVAIVEEQLLFRFVANGQRAYMIAGGGKSFSKPLTELIEDARAAGEPFLLLGVCENELKRLEKKMPGQLTAQADRNFADYVYERKALASLAGKPLQSKRNFINRFLREHPDYTTEVLTPKHFDDCLRLNETWMNDKDLRDETERLAVKEEQHAIVEAFTHWEDLDCRGMALCCDDRLVAFTYGAAINHDTFDICIEKADRRVEGAFAVINRDFARSLPECYRYVNREEDMGLLGLRQAKMSYSPAFLIHKYAVTHKLPFPQTP